MLFYLYTDLGAVLEHKHQFLVTLYDYMIYDLQPEPLIEILQRLIQLSESEVQY